MSFKIADGYVEVHARHDKESTRRNAREAADIAEEEGKKREGSMLAWLFKSNPKLMRTLEAPIGQIFGSPIIFAAAATAFLGIAGFASTAISSAILLGIGAGFIAGGAWVHANDKVIVDAYTNMKDKIKGVFYRASQPIVGPLVGAMGMIGDKVKEWEPSFNRIYTALAPLIEPFTGGVLGFIEGMLPGIERSLPGIQTVFLALADNLPGLGTAIGDFFATLSENGPLLKDVVGLMITWLENFFKVAGPVLVFFMYSFIGMAMEWKALMDALKAGWRWVDETWHAIPGWWNETWGAVSGWFAGLGKDIGGFFSGLWTTISTWWEDTGNSITGWWDRTWGSVTTWFSELPGKIGGFFAAIPGAIIGWIQYAFDQSTYIIGYALGTWVGLMIALPGKIVDGITGSWSIVTGWIDSALKWITDHWTAMQTWLILQVSTLPGKIGAFFQEMGAKIVLWVSKMFVDVMIWWDKLPGRFWGAVNDAWNRVIGVFRWGLTEAPRITNELAGRVVSAVLGLGSRMFNAGRDAIIGLINGIQSLMDWAVDAAWRAARNIAQGFMDALHIGSPSKYMADNVGKWIPKGIAVGIEDNMGDIDKLAMQLPETLIGGKVPPLAGSTSTDRSTNYGNITVEVHIDSLQELEDIKAFLDGRIKTTPKARTWAGNLYEAQGEYTRSYS